MILVTGATGKVGREAVRQLSGLGHRVRALTRRPGQADFPEGVEPVGGDVSDPASLTAAFEGVTQALVVLSGEVSAGARNVAAAAAAAGTGHVVLLSSASLEHPLPHAIADEHRAAEEAFTAAGVTTTVLRPGPFHANTTWWAETVRERGEVRDWIGNNPGAPVDEYDIASCAVAALTGAGPRGGTHLLTGPEVLTSEEQARILSGVLGRELTFSVAPAMEVVEIFTRLGGDRAAAVGNVAALRSPQVPWARPTAAVQELTGRAPRPYQEWAAANAALFG
ncbi:SDR family oxidoreductase [Streptomyces sp. S186]|uniref:SDR family oxidoreductase n=1 Tax=Streptomyces sp. S186 TaxID=3434395 RepID=UPI003F669FCD